MKRVKREIPYAPPCVSRVVQHATIEIPDESNAAVPTPRRNMRNLNSPAIELFRNLVDGLIPPREELLQQMRSRIEDIWIWLQAVSKESGKENNVIHVVGAM